MDAAIGTLQAGFLTEAQITASRAIMGLDTQLIAGRHVFPGHDRGRAGGVRAAGAGGTRSMAAITSPGRNAALLDPARDAARVRAMYTHPDFARAWRGTCHPGFVRTGGRRGGVYARGTGGDTVRAAAL